MSPFGWGGPSRRAPPAQTVVPSPKKPRTTGTNDEAGKIDTAHRLHLAWSHSQSSRNQLFPHRGHRPLSLAGSRNMPLPASHNAAAPSGRATGQCRAATAHAPVGCLAGCIVCVVRPLGTTRCRTVRARRLRGGGALVIIRGVVPVDADPRSRVEPTAVQQHARQQVGDLLVAGRGRSALTITLATSRARKTSSGDAGAAVPWRLVERRLRLRRCFGAPIVEWESDQ